MARRSMWPQGSETSTDSQSTNVIHNKVADAIRTRSFFWTIEFVVSAKHRPSDDEIILDDFVNELGSRREIAGFSVTDRVTSDEDPDPVAIAAYVAKRTGLQPLVHWSGKDRTIDDLRKSVHAIQSVGLQNVLFVTGDKLRNAPKNRRPRYLESVNAIHEAKQQMPELLVAAAVNPFKYREEEAMAQYLKMSKKIRAGADYLITQIGFDATKHEEVLFWMHANDCRIPIVANLMALNAARARYIRKNRLAGVIITDEFAELLERDRDKLTSDQAEERVMHRLALQILKVYYNGYAGIQVSGLHSVERLLGLRDALENLEREVTDRLSWDEAWRNAMTPRDRLSVHAAQCAPANGWYMTHRDPVDKGNRKDARRHFVMQRIHGSMFQHGIVARLLRRIMWRVERGDKTDKWLTAMEHRIKGPIFGCETCGVCRLALMQYICPETCPKGLANGACGGTNMNQCEYGDRECVHSHRYRLARDNDELAEMESYLIPAVPESVRNTSSWPPYLRNEAPKLIEDCPSIKKRRATEEGPED